MRVFQFFESLLEPTAVPTGAAPPAGLAAFYWHYAGPAGRAAGGALVAESDHQPGDHSKLLQSDSLAEPLARRAPELGVFSKRLRRSHFATRHADRPILARER